MPDWYPENNESKPQDDRQRSWQKIVAAGATFTGFEERFAANEDNDLSANEDGEIIKIGL